MSLDSPSLMWLVRASDYYELGWRHLLGGWVEVLRIGKEID